MDITPLKDGTLITLNQAFGSRLKMLNFFYAVLYFLGGHFFIIKYFHSDHNDHYLVIFYVLITIVCYIISYRFIVRAISSENLFIGPRELLIIRKKLFKSKFISFEIRKVTNLRYNENKSQETERKTGPPINLRSFLIRDPVIDQLGDDNRIAFDYENQSFFFGSGITSYEFDEIKAIFDHAQRGIVHKI